MKPDYSLLSESADIIERDEPELWGVVCPRRYATPSGYPSPRLNSAMLRIHLEMSVRPQPDKVAVDCILSCWKICDSLVPTYFVGEEFVEALVMTDPPENMTAGELNWPHDGMVFVLPERFQMRYFGRLVPFIRIATHPSGRHSPPERIQKLLPHSPKCGIDKCKFDENCFLITASVLFKGDPVEYSASFSSKHTLKIMMDDVTFTDFTYALQFSNTQGYEESRAMTADEDRLLMNRMIALAAHLLLAMNALPEHISDSTVQFPHSPKVQRATPANKWVWSPRFIGKNYVHEREKVSLGGTHASPRLHPRRGHWRNQPHGTGRALKKLIWIRPMLVGASSE